MPSTYAHYRFGTQVYRLLPGQIRKVITSHPDLFCAGLHGPDLLFYYRPLSSNPVNQTGYMMHGETGYDFFSFAADVIREHDCSPAHLAYIYGFLCHFALDQACHGYVIETAQKGILTHTEIEVEFDRRLLCYDGFDPVSHDLTSHIRPSENAAWIIGSFFPDIKDKEILSSMKSIIAYNRLLKAPCPLKRGVLYLGLKLAGSYEMHHHVIRYRPNPRCTDSNRILLAHYKRARKHAVRLIAGYLDTIHGKRPWDYLYSYTFNAQYTGSTPAERTSL